MTRVGPNYDSPLYCPPKEPKPGICRSHSRFGLCGLAINHTDDHAVPIGDDVWCLYRINGGHATSIGYRKLVDGQLVTAEHREEWDS